MNKRRCLNCMRQYDKEFDICPHCGYVAGSAPKEPYILLPGTLLQEEHYLIGTAVGIGGFGITYRAWDNKLDKLVAIKEYYPNGIAIRNPGQTRVNIYGEARIREYERGKDRFYEEAKYLGHLSEPANIVNVYDYFMENDTAYYVMEFLHGEPFNKVIKTSGNFVSVELGVKVAAAVLDALSQVHKEGIIHRDISPDNIFLVNNGQIKLFDFGAARFSKGKDEAEYDCILKPGYAPPEQYDRKSKQGPWTDIYAVGALLYRALTGLLPQESKTRMTKDELKPPHEIKPEIPVALSNSIMRAMALNYELRFQKAEEFKAAILMEKPVRDIGQELKRRKTLRAVRAGIIAAALCLCGFASYGVFVSKQNELYNLEASVSVWLPDTNQQKMDEVLQINDPDTPEAEKKKIALDSTQEMFGEKMLREFKDAFQKITLSEEKYIPAKDYGNELEAAAKKQQLPAVFDSSQITRQQQPKVWEQMGSLSRVYELLNLEDYYGLAEFHESYPEARQIPVSFSVPVLYVNTNMVKPEDIPPVILSAADLQAGANPGYCVSREYYEQFNEALGGSLTPPAGEYGYEDFLDRKAAYYLGSTDDYEVVRAGLGGIYRMITLKELMAQGKIYGVFTRYYSIREGLDEEQKKAAENMVFYLLSERAQDVYNIQNGNGLSVNREMMKIYVNSNDEFSGIYQALKRKTMTIKPGERK